MNNLGQMGVAMGYVDVSLFVSMTSIWGFFGRIASGTISEHFINLRERSAISSVIDILVGEEVCSSLLSSGHDVHVVIAAPEFVFTTEIASPSLSDKLASPSTSEILAPAPWMEAQNRLPSRILHHASRPLPSRKPPPAHSPPPHPLSGACATASLDQRHAYAITPSLLLPPEIVVVPIYALGHSGFGRRPDAHFLGDSGGHIYGAGVQAGQTHIFISKVYLVFKLERYPFINILLVKRDYDPL
ncbi:hypothetical protein Zm00014a_024240 [Zea mays]|uniref:Uncharacterized protein n=1 Tax=Zea mays TaxID=4577 RepID=A0A3L6DNS6_MAIZE|nr:hypothetical protein Zm00014a_024240 [Zea mays]